MRQNIGGAGVEKEPERLLVLHLLAGGRRRHRLTVVGHLGEVMQLPLRLGLEADASQKLLVGDLDAIVEGLPDGAALGVAGFGTACLEEMEFAALMREANRGAAI